MFGFPSAGRGRTLTGAQPRDRRRFGTVGPPSDPTDLRAEPRPLEDPGSLQLIERRKPTGFSLETVREAAQK